VLHIDLFSDVICPWCFIGMHRLNRVLAERFPDLPDEIHHHPVLLVPDLPAEGANAADMLRQRHGLTHVKPAWAVPHAAARASGLDLDLSLQPNVYPTQAAHALVHAARQYGTEHRLAFAIAQAYFQESRNIADPSVLAEIAEGYGFSSDEVRAIALDQDARRDVEDAAALARAAGVTFVPLMVVNGAITIPGGRQEDEIAAAITQALPAPALI
jgi:predicted DsbA family dithiol-disulfide isomerase